MALTTSYYYNNAVTVAGTPSSIVPFTDRASHRVVVIAIFPTQQHIHTRKFSASVGRIGQCVCVCARARFACLIKTHLAVVFVFAISLPRIPSEII